MGFLGRDYYFMCVDLFLVFGIGSRGVILIEERGRFVGFFYRRFRS